MAGSKKRIIKSLDSLTEDLRELLRQQYPNGYEASISRIKNAKNEPIFVFPLETEDAIYLVKVPATRNSEGEYAVESSKKQEFENPDDDGFGGSGSAGGGGGDEDFDSAAEGDDYDNSEEGEGKSREASYDPDFDN